MIWKRCLEHFGGAESENGISFVELVIFYISLCLCFWHNGRRSNYGVISIYCLPNFHVTSLNLFPELPNFFYIKVAKNVKKWKLGSSQNHDPRLISPHFFLLSIFISQCSVFISTFDWNFSFFYLGKSLFGLVSLFNGISPFMGYLVQNPGKGVVPYLHLSVVAIEKRAFKSPLTTVANLLLYNAEKFLTQVGNVCAGQELHNQWDSNSTRNIMFSYTLGNGLNLLRFGLNSITAVLQQGWLWH